MVPLSRFPLSGVDSIAEAVASRDNNNLYRTSCFFHDVERYRAFCAQYAVMRVVDDRIDSLPSRVALAPSTRRAEQEIVSAWRAAVRSAHRGEPVNPEILCVLPEPSANALLHSLTSSFTRFPMALNLWETFFDSMMSDLGRSRFETYEEFLTYAEGATVAPTTIYLDLLTADRQVDGRYLPAPGFDLVRCGRALGLFAYLGHILRDLADDLSTGQEGLLYLSADDMRRHRLTEEMLFADLAAGSASNALRALVATLIERARAALTEGRTYFLPLDGRLRPDCGFIVNLIIAIYEAVLDKIEACGCDPMARRHHLTDEEKLEIIRKVAGSRSLDTDGGQPVAPGVWWD